MAPRRKVRARETQLVFEALTIEGSLLSPEWLSKVAQQQAAHQTDADYRIHKGLALRDEIGRYWRIAQAHWSDFKTGREKQAEAGSLADRFVLGLLRDAFGFGTIAKVEPQALGGRTYPVGYAALEGRIPVVIAPAGSGLDTLSPAFGEEGRRRSAFGLAQEYLNADERALWGLATDGVTLRLCRDNASLTRPAWIEADLGRVFVEERYADFAALWLLIHESRFGAPGQAVADCPLEAWRSSGREEGTRARERLREGVEDALVDLGRGFLTHADNQVLRAALHGGLLTRDAYFQQLLRLVYRVIFLLTAEERAVLHPPDAAVEAKELFEKGYSLRRLRDRSAKRSAHDRFGDLWEGLKITFRGVATGEPILALPALGGLFAKDQCPDLDGARLENRWLMAAVFKLAWVREESGLARVNWRDMGPEELGSVYESLLELVPLIPQDGHGFSFATGDETKGNARKTTGSYYTPEGLVQVLLDSALEPVIHATVAAHPEDPAEALLNLAVVDPACGSGHFLLAAARRLAVHVARHQANGTPSAEQYRHAVRQVVSRCLFGVDLNPMAVELCRVSLWMEAVEPGRPLSFLDSHVQRGNALLGATPELMKKGIPDTAFEPIEGDDKKTASLLKKRNKEVSEKQGLFDTLWSKQAGAETDEVARAVAALDAVPDADLAAVAGKEARWEELQASEAFRHQKFVADAWCAAFVWPKPELESASGGKMKKASPVVEAAPTNALWLQIQTGKGQPPALTVDTVNELTDQYHFFHWHLAFPQVFSRGGFDLVVGNPPWDSLSPDRREYFGKHQPGLRSMSPAEQDKAIDHLLEDPVLASAWARDLREVFGLIHFLKNSGRFTLFAQGNLGKGDFNIYRMFVEVAFKFARPGGFAAQLVPAGFRGGANSSAIRQHVFQQMTLHLVMSFINAGRQFFPAVHGQFQFMLYVAERRGETRAFQAVFGVTSPASLTGGGVTPLTLHASQIRKNAPETWVIPDVRSASDLTVTAKMVERFPPFGSPEAGPPVRHYQRELDMGNDRGVFTDDPAGLPVYEGRMVGPFDHRAKTYASGHGNSSLWEERRFGDAGKAIVPQWRVLRRDVPGKLGDRCDRFRLCFRDVAQPTDIRSLIATLIPAGVICGHKVPTIVFDPGWEWAYLPWLAVANSFVMDWMTRSKLTSPSVTFSLVDSLPFPRPALDEAWVRNVAPTVLRLVCTSPEMTPYWNAMAQLGLCKASHPGTVPQEALLDETARTLARAELDAVVAHDVFGLTRTELGDLLETFPIVKSRDMEAHGEYRTKRIILEVYDAKAEAIRTGNPYQTRLDPPAADPRLAHLPKRGKA